MANHTENNTKLGMFVFAGLMVLILTFYMIGKNLSMFGSNFELKARFSDSNGLLAGNNVFYSGIQAGTVKSIAILNDTTIELTLLIDVKLKPFIHKNAIVSIGTEGLMGNKIVQIFPQKGAGSNVEDGTLLSGRKTANMDDMMQTLSRTSQNIEGISKALRETVIEINESSVLELLKDKKTGPNLRSTLMNINETSIHANELSQNLNELVMQVKKGKGGAGLLLSDTGFAANLNKAVTKISSASDHANNLAAQLDQIMKGANQKNGFLGFLLKDSLFVKRLNTSMDNIEKGTDGFNQNMEALKHNFLLRGYFKKLEKKKAKNP